MGFSNIHVKRKSILNLEKKKTLYLEVFLYFYTSILCNYMGYQGYFSTFTLFLNFLMRKTAGACWVIQWPKRVFCHLLTCATIFSSMWGDVWQFTIVGLLPLIFCFPPFFFLSQQVMYNIVFFLFYTFQFQSSFS